jgi:hypothetical protein
MELLNCLQVRAHTPRRDAHELALMRVRARARACMRAPTRRPILSRAGGGPGRPACLVSSLLTFLPADDLPAWRFFISEEPVMPLFLILSAASRMAAFFSSPAFCAASYLARAAALASSRACSSGVRLAAAAASASSAAPPPPLLSNFSRIAAFFAFSAAFFACFRACFSAAASACRGRGDKRVGLG